MNYFQACRAERLFCEYKKLAQAYWALHERCRLNNFTDGSGELLQLREQITFLLPEVDSLVRMLGIAVKAKSLPSPLFGGYELPVNVLLAVVDQEQGHEPFPEIRILDVINRAIEVLPGSLDDMLFGA